MLKRLGSLKNLFASNKLEKPEVDEAVQARSSSTRSSYGDLGAILEKAGDELPLRALNKNREIERRMSIGEISPRSLESVKSTITAKDDDWRRHIANKGIHEKAKQGLHEITTQARDLVNEIAIQEKGEVDTQLKEGFNNFVQEKGNLDALYDIFKNDPAFNDQQRESVLRYAADAGHSLAGFNLAKMLYGRGDVDEGFPYAAQACKSGHGLVNAYFKGKSVEILMEAHVDTEYIINVVKEFSEKNNDNAQVIFLGQLVNVAENRSGDIQAKAVNALKAFPGNKDIKASLNTLKESHAELVDKVQHAANLPEPHNAPEVFKSSQMRR